jgi:hypothetical protein
VEQGEYEVAIVPLTSVSLVTSKTIKVYITEVHHNDIPETSM